MEPIFRFDRFFPYALPPVLSLLICIFLASLMVQTGRVKRENQLFTIYCILQTFLFLDIILLCIVSSQIAALSISRLTHSVYVFVLPISVQFIHQVAGFHNRKWLERGLYIFSLCLVPFIQTKGYFSGLNNYFFGYFAQGGPVFQIFCSVGIGATIYVISILWNQIKSSKNPEQRIKLNFLLYGFVLNTILTIGNVFPISGFNVYPTGNFGFIPIGLMAYGVLRHQLLDTTMSWFKKGYIPRILGIMSWSPVFIAIIFGICAKQGTFHPNLYDRIVPYSIPPILSVITCFGLATLCFLKGSRRADTMLFGFICILWGGLNIDKIMGALLVDGALALQISRIDHFFLVFQVGLYAHFLKYFVNFPKRGVYFCYGIGLFFMPLTQTDLYYQGVFEYYWGFSAHKNIAFTVFGAISFLLIILGCYMLFAAAKSTSDPNKKSQYVYFLLGGAFTGILNLGNIPSLSGIEFYPPGNFTFIPILIMAYGVFRYDIVKINFYAQKRTLGNIVNLIVALGYLALIPVCVWALQEYHLDFIIHRIIPYGIPPLLSFLCCALISLLSLQLGQNQKESLIFSLFTLLYAFINMDILLNGIVSDPQVGMQISRWAHFFFVFGFSLALHLVYLVCKCQTRWWIVYCAYGVSFILAPLTQTPVYIEGMNTYYWGFFAKGALFFDIMGYCGTAGLIYGVSLLYFAYKTTISAIQKHRIRWLFIGFVAVAILSFGNLPAMEGYEVYPLGNFMFIPMSIFAYGLFKTNFNEALRIIRMIALWLGTIWLLFCVAILITTIIPIEKNTLPFLMVVFAVGFYSPLKGFWNMILDFFIGQRRESFKQNLEELNQHLSKIHQVQAIFNTLTTPIFEYLLAKDFAMLVFSKSDPGFMGWESRNPAQGFFADDEKHSATESAIALSIDHPLLSFFNKHFPLISQEHVEEWILTHDISLAPDERLRLAELIQPIFFEDRLMCLLLFGHKIDGSVYSKDEKEFLHQLGMTLGPYIENAKLLQSLEATIKDRTHDLQKALNETRVKEQEITHINQVVQIVNSFLDLDKVMTSVMEVLQEIFKFDALAILLINNKRQQLVMHKVYGDLVKEQHMQQYRRINIPINSKDCLNYYVLQTKEPIYLTNITPDINMLPIDRKIYDIMPFKSALFLHLAIQNHVVGVINFFGVHEDIVLTQEDIYKIQRYVSQIANAVSNALIHNDLKEARKIAEAATKSKSEFLANMSHEIRTPMNAIIGLSSLIQETELSRKQRDYAQKIYISAQSLLGIINDILDFSKIEAGKLGLEQVEFHLFDIMENLSNMVYNKAGKKNIELNFFIENDVPCALIGDPLRLGQILINLTSNAIKFTDKGNIVVQVSLGGKKPDQVRLQFSVMDTGIGIAEDQISHLFEPFSQADGSTTRRYGGTGLGLAICKKIVEMMGGRIWIESELGKGSTFYFEVECALQPDQSESTLEISDTVKDINALVVDDNIISRKVMERVLRSFKFQVTSVDSGEAALAELKNNLNQKSYNLIFMDWQLPGIDGIETSRKIRIDPALSGIPIIMISAFDVEGKLPDLAQQAGINTTLIKSVNPSLLFDTVMDVLGHKMRPVRKRRVSSQRDFEAMRKVQGLRVLVVEDNKINQQVARETLEKAGILVEIANNGAEAVQIMTDFENTANLTIDAILMDIQMSIMDGYIATRQIRNLTSHGKTVPIIAMTAHAMKGDREKCLEAGMNDYVTKPINPKKLVRTLAKWIQFNGHRKPLISIENVSTSKDDPASIDALPDQLAGVDMAAGLNNAGGNEKLFKKLLGDFHLDYKHSVDTIKESLNNEDKETAKRIVHTLKGVSGNIGAKRLYTAAKTLDMAFVKKDLSNINRLVESFEQALEELVVSTGTLMTQAQIDETTEKINRKIDKKQVASLINQLWMMLKKSDAVAAEKTENLKNYLSETHLNEQLNLIMYQIDDCEFEKAQKVLLEISKNLDIPISNGENALKW